MVVLPPDEGAQVTEHPFDLGCESEFPFRVNILVVGNWPAIFNALVNTAPVSLQSRAWSNVPGYELGDVMLLDVCFGNHPQYQLLGSNVLGPDDRVFPQRKLHPSAPAPLMKKTTENRANTYERSHTII